MFCFILFCFVVCSLVLLCFLLFGLVCFLFGFVCCWFLFVSFVLFCCVLFCLFACLLVCLSGSKTIVSGAKSKCKSRVHDLISIFTATLINMK